MSYAINHAPDLGSIVVLNSMVHSLQTQGFYGQALRRLATQRASYKFDSYLIHA